MAAAQRLSILARQLHPREGSAAPPTTTITAAADGVITSSVDPARFVHEGKKIVGVGKNYRAHIAELSQGENALWQDDAASHAQPVLFLKPTTSSLQQGAPIVIPPGIGEVHHEIELGVVIGTACRHVSERDAMACVAGFCLAIDLTAREVQLQAKKRGEPWMVSKSYETFCPVSDFIPIASDAQNYADLTLWLTVNGQERQRGNTGDMIHPVPELIAFISSVMTLEPGDCILTGTPVGVGPVRAGDRVMGGLEVARTQTSLAAIAFDCV
jgi:acylpyruvate hydrolase